LRYELRRGQWRINGINNNNNNHHHHRSSVLPAGRRR
jgi:hypothetical protein